MTDPNVSVIWNRSARKAVVITKSCFLIRFPSFLCLGFVGLVDALLLSPILLTWHYTKVETFELPPSPNTWTLLLVNGFIGTVLSELLWLWYVLSHVSHFGNIALFELLVWPHEVEPWFSFLVQRLGQRPQMLNIISYFRQLSLNCQCGHMKWSHGFILYTGRGRVETLDAKYNLIFI